MTEHTEFTRNLWMKSIPIRSGPREWKGFMIKEWAIYFGNKSFDWAEKSPYFKPVTVHLTLPPFMHVHSRRKTTQQVEDINKETTSMQVELELTWRFKKGKEHPEGTACRYETGAHTHIV